MTGWAKAILKLFLFQREKIQVTRFHLFQFQLLIFLVVWLLYILIKVSLKLLFYKIKCKQVFTLRFQFFWIILQPPAFTELLCHGDYHESLIWLVSMKEGGGWLFPPPINVLFWLYYGYVPRPKPLCCLDMVSKWVMGGWWVVGV